MCKTDIVLSIFFQYVNLQNRYLIHVASLHILKIAFNSYSSKLLLGFFSLDSQHKPPLCFLCQYLSFTVMDQLCTSAIFILVCLPALLSPSDFRSHICTKRFDPIQHKNVYGQTTPPYYNSSFICCKHCSSPRAGSDLLPGRITDIYLFVTGVSVYRCKLRRWTWLLLAVTENSPRTYT